MKRDPEKIFGIHPAEAAYRLTQLPPYLFRLIQQYALLGSYNATQQAMGINHKVLKVYFFRAKKILGASKAFDVWRIWYAAQFLYLYQEDDE